MSAGAITDGGYNIATDTSRFWTNTHTLKNTDPRVFNPAWNGGYTMTMALSNSSPALDAIPLTHVFPPFDQRGIHRPLGTAPDIGADQLATSAAIIQQPTSVVQTNGNTVSLGVSATGASGLRLSYWWRFYGTNVMTPTNVPGQIGATYSFLPLQLTNAGYYDVVVSNRLGAVTSQVVSLSILPSITKQPVSIEAFEQTLAYFQVTSVGETADGDRSQYFTWQYNGSEPPRGIDQPDRDQFHLHVHLCGCHQRRQLHGRGHQRCRRHHQRLGHPSVDPAPTISPTNQTVAPGQPANFTVTALGEPAFTYQWQHAGTVFETLTNLPSANGVTFTIPNAQTNASGVYQVVVSGDFNPGYAQAYLTVGTVTPEGPTLLDPIIQANNGQFTFAFQSAANATYVIQDKTHLSDATWTTLVTTNGTGGMLTIPTPPPPRTRAASTASWCNDARGPDWTTRLGPDWV